MWREITLSRSLGRWSPHSQATPHDFLLFPLPVSHRLGQSPLQDPRPFRAVGQQQNVPGL